MNPLRVRLAVPEDDRLRARMDLLVAGSLVVVAAAAVGAALANELLAGLDVSPESFRIAAGIVLGVDGIRLLLGRRPNGEPSLPGRLAALVPVAFPLLVTPELTMLVLSAGADESVGATIAALALALALACALGVVRRGPRTEGILGAGSRMVAALLVVVGVALVVDGVRDV